MGISQLPDDAELERLYIEENLSMPAIGLIYGVSRQRVHQRIQKADIKRPKLSLDRATLKKLYVREELKLQQVAERLGVTEGFVRSELRRYEIPLRPRKRHRFGRELLYKLYVTDGMLMREVAKKLGCGQTSIANEIKRNCITERHSTSARRKLLFTRDQLHSFYVEQKLSSRQIAKLVGGHKGNVRYWLKKYGIPRRAGGKIRREIDKRRLRRLYLKEEMPIRLIAEEFGVSVSLVYNRLKRFGIIRKPKA